MRVPNRQSRWAIRIWRFTSRNLGVRFLVALALSTLVWTGLTLDQNPNAQELFQDNLPVSPVNRPSRLVLASEIEPVRVSVEGPKINLARLTLRDFVARVDLREVSVGSQQLPVEVTVSDPAVRVARITPMTVTVVLDELETRMVPIVPQIQSAPAPGFRAEVDRISSDPTEARVNGASSALNQVAAVHAMLSLEGSTSTVTRQTLLRPVDRQGSEVANVLVEPQIAQVTVTVTRITSRKRVPVLVNLAGEPTAGFIISRLSVVPSTVEIEGQPENLERENAVSTQVVDISGARGDVHREVGFLRPPGILVISDRPLADVTVRVEPLEDTTTLQTAVVLNNLGPGMRVTTDDPFVQIVIAGPSEVLAGIRGGDLVAEVDLRNRVPGLHDIQPVISVPPGLRVERVIPTVIGVRITLVSRPSPVTTTTATPVPGAGGVVPTKTPTPAPASTPT